MNAPFYDVFESFSNPPVDKQLRREGDLPALDPGLQEVANVEADLLPDLLG